MPQAGLIALAIAAGVIVGVVVAAAGTSKAQKESASLPSPPRIIVVTATAAPPDALPVTITPPQHLLVPPAPERSARPGIPMAMATSGLPGDYQQIGIVRSDVSDFATRDHEDRLFPLYGRKMQHNRDRWNYYVAHKSGGTLPVRKGNRNCMDHNVGCSEIYDGDSITVDGLVNEGAMRAMTFGIAQPQYDPNVF